MTRLDWLLVRPPRTGKKRTETIREIEDNIGLLVHESSRKLLTEAQIDLLSNLEADLEDLTLSTCEAVNAPRLKDAPDADDRLEAEYEDEDTDEDFAAWRAQRAEDFDCECCPFASPYSLYPVNPCEMNGGPLLDILADHPSLCKQAQRPMTPAKMLALAAIVDECLTNGAFRSTEGLDAADYLQHVRRFLTRWASFGFGIIPDYDADAPVHTPDGVLTLKQKRSSAVLH